MGFIDRLSGDIAYLRGALRTLKATTPIAKNPTRVFPDVVDGLAEKFDGVPALLSDRESFTYRELAAVPPSAHPSAHPNGARPTTRRPTNDPCVRTSSSSSSRWS